VFLRVRDEPLPLLYEKVAAHLYRCPLDGDVDDAAPLLLIGSLTGTSVVLDLFERLVGR
jgi:hypothetical protein